MKEDDENSGQQLRKQELVFEFIEDRLRSVDKVYRQAMTSLWLGNGAAAGAILTFVGGTVKEGKIQHLLLLPLIFFVLGLIAMGVGTAIYLYKEIGAGQRMERAESLLNLRTSDIKSPYEKAGLTFSDWRTRMALISTACFICGCISGLIELLFVSLSGW